MMVKKLTLVAGFGAGYVLGAKAGHERYRQIEAKFREIAGMPAVQHATASVKETASGLADTAKTAVVEKAAEAADSARATASDAKSAVSEKVKPAEKEPVIDLSSGASGAATSSPAPMAGAAASATAPDITHR